MNKEQYLQQRKTLMTEAEKLISDGKFDEGQEKMKEVEELDDRWEQAKIANANLNALKDNHTATNLEDKSVDVKGGTVVGHFSSKQTEDKKEQYLNAWAKSMMGQKLEGNEQTVFDEFNANVQNAAQTAAEHAVLIPETVREGIWKEAGELYPILGDVNMTFVPGDLTILQETDSGDDAAWYDEETEVADGDFAIGELNLTGCELAKAIPISWKLRKMSIEAFIPYITSLLAEKMGAALAKAIVSGQGKPGTGDTFKPQPKGVVTAIEAESGTPQVITYSDSDALSYDKLASAMGLVKSSYKNGSAIYAKSTVIWDVLAKIKDNDGRPIFIPDVTVDGVGRIFGVPVKEEDSVPDGGILFGNVARGYAMNANEDITIYTEDHIKARYTDYMTYAIVDGDVLTTKAFAYIKEEIPEG